MASVMKKILLTLLVTTISTSAFAEWTLVAETIDGDKFFIDSTTIRRDDKYVTVTQMANYASLQSASNKNWKSDISEMRFNCNNTNSLVMTVKLYAENNANGEVVASYKGGDENDSQLITGDTTAALMFDYVCHTNIY
jgi:hypothetical protein